MISFSEFTPEPIKWQNNFVHDFFQGFDWNEIHEIMLSGAVGSAKTTVASWLAIHECMTQRNVQGLIARKTLPDLKKTLFLSIWDMLAGSFKEGRDFQVNETQGSIWFPRTNSQLLPGYWRDKRYKKFRSLELTFAIIEELTENNEEDKQAYDEIMMRIGRRKGQRHFMLTMTNPDAPTSWQYKHFIEGQKKVYYSVTEDNPFLDPRYVAKLKKDLPPALADRMLRGLWTEINKDKVYYAYSREKNFKNQDYRIIEGLPVTLCFDFNIADGKPMSSCAYQFTNDHFHVFDQAIVEGARTMDIMEEWLSKGVLDKSRRFIIHGDATGQARDTRSIMSDYQLITKFMQQHGFQFVLEVPRSNPPIRTRHNRVNTYCQNDLGESRLSVYKSALKVDEGLRLTALKKGGQYIEDDSKDYQHVTTALGYGIVYDTNRVTTKATSYRKA
jgi:hypothetical protein